MILYKYLSSENAIKVIGGRSLRFTQPSELNDVFELRPYYENWNEASVLKTELTRNKIRAGTGKFFDDLFTGLPPELKQIFEENADLDGAVPKAQNILRNIFDGISAAVPQHMFEHLDKLAGVLCLSEIADSNVMWGQYGAEHRGVALGFNSEYPYFNRTRSNEDDLRHLVKVDYLPERARVQLLEDPEAGHKILYSKTDSWSAEREWRMLHALQDADEIIEAQPPVHLFRFDPECLLEVIFGCRTSEEDKQRIQELLDGNFAHVKILQVRPDDVSNQLHIVEANT